MSTDIGSSTAPAGLAVADPIAIHFPVSNQDSGRTHWRWRKGEGQLRMSGEQVTLAGRRLRIFLPSRPQSVTFLRNQVCDVVQQAQDLHCVVTLEDGRREPLALRFGSEAAAREFAARLPTVRSAESLAQESFHLAVARLGVRVWVTPTMAALCVLVFIAMAVNGVPLFGPRGPELIPWGTNYGPQTLRGEPWRLLTSVFLHFGFAHLLLNMVSLLLLGPLTEKLLGNVRFLVMYLVAGLSGSMVSVWWNPSVNSAGASGAIFGVMGGLLASMLNRRARVPRAIAVAQARSILVFLGLNLANSLRPGIDMAAHLGGLGAGFVLAWCFARPLPQQDEPPERHSMALGLVAAVGILMVLAQPLLYPGKEQAARRALRFAVQDFLALQRPAVTRSNELDRLANDGKISDRDWAERTLAEVVPLWDKAMDAALLVPAGTTRDERTLVISLPDYVSNEMRMRELYAEGILEADEDKSRAANRLHERQTALWELIEGWISRL